MHFEATEENKLIYMDIFKKYTETIEAYITQVKLVIKLNRDLERKYRTSVWKDSWRWLHRERMRLMSRLWICY